MRSLASVQKILDIKPIENADAIELAKVLGWNVVVKKGEFKVGDPCIYIEIDSVLPPKPEFEFLAPKYRIKTIKLRGQISQGICFPLSILPGDVLFEGQDVTEALGVTKYEIPVPAQLAGKTRGGFPGFLPKTDEVRLQAYPGILSNYKHLKWYITEKVDGSSTTFVIKNGEFHVCSRSLDLLDDGVNTIWKVAKQMKVEEKMRSSRLEERIAIQGEIVGEKIQGNKLGFTGQVILFFNAYDFVENRYLNYDEFVDLFNEMQLPTVPILYADIEILPTVDLMVTMATKKSTINPHVWLEGMVWRPMKETFDDKFGRLSFKVINPEFLIKNNE